jgi:rSAM/selenodomain-associated transferase 1
MKNCRHLVVFAKAPRIGAVKRRLAAGIGDGAAWRFYSATSLRVLRRVARDPAWRCWLAVTPDRFAAKGRFWPAGIARIPQGPGGLGERMARPIQGLPPGPVVIIGTDIPALHARHIRAAFDALRSNDVVFGPAGDGGYWLIGLNRCPRRREFAATGLFTGVRFSTSAALADTRANLDPRFRVAMLERLDDVDDAAAFARWRTGRKD